MSIGSEAEAGRLFFLPRPPPRVSEAFREKIQERLDPRGSLPTGQKGRPERKALQLLQVFQQRNEPSVTDRFRNDDVATGNDTRYVDRQLQQHVCAVRGNRTSDVHLYGLSIDIERPRPGPRNMAQGQTRMFREFVRADGLAALRQISRTCTNNLCQ